ncbi:MAG: RNA polymerase-binding protein DksA [Helicobacteraceae bacterium]|jgi:DnaK suppressor protein|nr:RNA polymerase-binding protein DksA [Helicobacteraceae bacterium]
MRSRELEKFARVLNRQKTRIIHNIRKVAEEFESSVKSEVNDDADYASLTSENLIETAIVEKQMRELKEIEHALSKIKQGTYGICEMCGEPIGLERMRVKPHARFCITCREAYEKSSD